MTATVAFYPSRAEAPNFPLMDRGGGVYLQPGSPFWMIRFRFKDRFIRESSRTASKREALAYLKRRMAEFGLGEARCSQAIPTFAEAVDVLLAHIRATGKSAYPQVRSHLRSLSSYFGAETLIAQILPEGMEAYVRRRRSQGLKDASVHNELSTLRRCLRLQWKRGRLLVLPEFPMPVPGRPRQGFFMLEEVERLCEHLPAHAVNAVLFAWETGWRRGEIFGLRWQDVDWDAGLILLRDSKNGQARQLPFGQSEELTHILRVQRATASAVELERGIQVEYVFHYAGRRLPEGLRRCWATACRKAGLETRLFHDLRRSFVQRCEDASVARSSAMKITGHKTEAIYARYAIAPRASLANALQTLAIAKQEVDKSSIGKRKPRRNVNTVVSMD